MTARTKSPGEDGYRLFVFGKHVRGESKSAINCNLIDRLSPRIKQIVASIILVGSLGIGAIPGHYDSAAG
jgi:hypothetical protein